MCWMLDSCYCLPLKDCSRLPKSCFSCPWFILVRGSQHLEKLLGLLRIFESSDNGGERLAHFQRTRGQTQRARRREQLSQGGSSQTNTDDRTPWPASQPFAPLPQSLSNRKPCQAFDIMGKEFGRVLCLNPRPFQASMNALCSSVSKTMVKPLNPRLSNCSAKHAATPPCTFPRLPHFPTARSPGERTTRFADAKKSRGGLCSRLQEFPQKNVLKTKLRHTPKQLCTCFFP